jgi:hypothetical protein
MPNQVETNVFELTDLCTPWCVHVAATLGVAGHIAAGRTMIDDLAATTGANPENLGRVLRHLVSKGVFEEPAPGRFALNGAARSLLAPEARWLSLDGIGGRMAHAWGTMLSAVKTGAPAYHEVFGRPFWEDLEAHPEIAKSFDDLMGPGHGTPDAEVLITGGWENVRTVVDVAEAQDRFWRKSCAHGRAFAEYWWTYRGQLAAPLKFFEPQELPSAFEPSDRAFSTRFRRVGISTC